jgi:hypothetical protein
MEAVLLLRFKSYAHTFLATPLIGNHQKIRNEENFAFKNYPITLCNLMPYFSVIPFVDFQADFFYSSFHSFFMRCRQPFSIMILMEA